MELDPTEVERDETREVEIVVGSYAVIPYVSEDGHECSFTFDYSGLWDCANGEYVSRSNVELREPQPQQALSNYEDGKNYNVPVLSTDGRLYEQVFVLGNFYDDESGEIIHEY